MFTFKAVSVFLALASSAVAVPTASPWNGPWNGHGNWGHWWNKQCLTNAAAQNIVDAYVSLTSGAGPFDIAVAQALLAPGFSDSSSSIASVIDMGMAPIIAKSANGVLIVSLQVEQCQFLFSGRHSTGALSLAPMHKQ